MSRRPYASAMFAMLACGIAGCRPLEEQPPAEPQLIDWTVSWSAPRTHEDGSALTGKPLYQLQMAPNAEEGPWTTVWTGDTTRATVKATPGMKCFRAYAVEGGIRSVASPPRCATKLAGGQTRHSGG